MTWSQVALMQGMCIMKSFSYGIFGGFELFSYVATILIQFKIRWSLPTQSQQSLSSFHAHSMLPHLGRYQNITNRVKNLTRKPQRQQEVVQQENLIDGSGNAAHSMLPHLGHHHNITICQAISPESFGHSRKNLFNGKKKVAYSSDCPCILCLLPMSE